MRIEELKEFLEEKTAFYNQPRFIDNDPIQVPHAYNEERDIEIAAFLTATISWGRRVSIINNAKSLLHILGESPYDFVLSASNQQLGRLKGFCHRTFNEEDARTFILGLRQVYRQGGMEKPFTETESTHDGIVRLRNLFFGIPHPVRTKKHFSDPSRNSAAKRINMFLRWMARSDRNGVDFGIWKSVHPKQLMLPLDVHTSNVARRLGILQRKQNDWKAVEEVTGNLRKFDKNDPVKYDFALFGLGAIEGFS